MQDYQDLVDGIKTGNSLLFVGAGVSATLGLPTWNDLIRHMAGQLGYDPDVFASMGDNLSLAEYYILMESSIGKLRSWMDRSWHTSKVKIEESEIHNLIVQLGFPIIYTTNYDRWLETAFDTHNVRVNKIINVRDVKKIDNTKPQIVKFHGDFDDDESIVLTETSYFERLTFESPLDIKLRSDILGRNILFIGYSLQDINMRYLLYKLYKIWADSPYAVDRPRSYIFLSKHNPVQRAILEKWGIATIFSDEIDQSKALLGFLRDLYDRVSS